MNHFFIATLIIALGLIAMYAISSTAKEQRRTKEAAENFRFNAHLQLHQFLVEVRELEAGRIEKTDPLRGFWLERRGPIYRHWCEGSGSEFHQQLLHGFDLTRWAEIRLGLR